MDNNGIPLEIAEKAQEACENLLPNKTKALYLKNYEVFKKWKIESKVSVINEDVMLAYLSDCAKTKNPSTLWPLCFMLWSTILLYENVDISKFAKLHGYLKNATASYEPKQAKILTEEQVESYIENAPDETHLCNKVILIMVMCGACRKGEIYNIKKSDVEEKSEVLIVKIITTKNENPRIFAITGKFYNICKKYIDLRPKDDSGNKFFTNYQNGRRTKQPVGVNKIGNNPRVIAKYLKLPNPENYTGHCLCRTSATVFVNAGADITKLKRFGGWKSTAVAEKYIDDSIENKKQVCAELSKGIFKNASSTVTSTNQTSENASSTITHKEMTNENSPKKQEGKNEQLTIPTKLPSNSAINFNISNNAK